MATEEMGDDKTMKKQRHIKLILFFVITIFFAKCNIRHETKSEQDVKTIPESGNNLPVQGGSIFNAALNGDIDLVRKVLQSGYNVNQTDQDGRTALMYAAFNGHAEVAKILLAHKTDVNLRDPEGRTALMFASSGPFPETVKLLLDHQADPNIVDFQEHFTALMYAAAEGQLENVKILLGNKADPSLKDIDGDNALTFARNNGHLEVARLLEEMND
jgi:ankyrin repeat protein